LLRNKKGAWDPPKPPQGGLREFGLASERNGIVRVARRLRSRFGIQNPIFEKFVVLIRIRECLQKFSRRIIKVTSDDRR